MKFEELIILLPCHSLEDFPTHHEGDDAQGLLANWSALWHPAFLASSEAIPAWYRADDPPEEVANRLIVVPGVAQSEIPTGFAQRAKESGACFIRNKLDREEIVQTALQSLDGGAAAVTEDIAMDFLALGYCYLQVELLTRQMRYSSNLDEIHFQNQVIAGAKAAVEGNEELAKEKLAACFDVLAEERDHYYPVDAFAVDLTMLAPTTIGPSLREMLQSGSAANLLLSGELLEEIAKNEPDTLSAIKQALDAGRLGVIGGEYAEQRLPLLSVEAIFANLKKGLTIYEQLLGKRPTIFGRRRFGLTPMLPQILSQLGFEGALHATLEDGVFPEGSQVKVRWEGSDGSGIDAIARSPLDASKPETYLGLAVKMGETMDMDHVAAICLAHWPGRVSPWYRDLQRINSYCSALGKFVTIEDFFRETDLPVHNDRFEASQYRSPYLKQAVIRKHEDPISTSVRYWRGTAATDTANRLSVLSDLITGKSHAQRQPEQDSAADNRPSPSDEPQTSQSGAESQSDVSSVDEVAPCIDTALERFADCLPRTDKPAGRGCLVANSASFVRRIGVCSDEIDDLPAVVRPIYAADRFDESKQVVVDVPAMGFAWLGTGGPPPRVKKPPKPLAEELLLRNEFMEVVIDPTTGALRALHDYRSRGNRLSQQLAMRLQSQQRSRSGEVWQESDDNSIYSVMAADSVTTTVATTALGEIVSRGRLLDREGNLLAGFRQTYRLWRGSRVLQLEMEIDPQAECKSDPWNSYFAARFAWATAGAEIFRTVNGVRTATDTKRFEAPNYIEINDGATRTAILTGGLPFHRVQGMRSLDSLLIVRGETARTFHLGIGVDLTHPMQEALSFMMPPALICQTAAPPVHGSSWLFHIDAKNVLATYWEPLYEADRIVGFRTRLLETEGRPAKAKLSSFRVPQQARKVNFAGEKISDLKIDDGRIEISLSGSQWVEIEARW